MTYNPADLRSFLAQTDEPACARKNNPAARLMQCHVDSHLRQQLPLGQQCVLRRRRILQPVLCLGRQQPSQPKHQCEFEGSRHRQEGPQRLAQDPRIADRRSCIDLT